MKAGGFEYQVETGHETLPGYPADTSTLPFHFSRGRLLRQAAPSAQQIDDENHKRDHQQQMDEASADVETKAQKPQDP